MKEVKISTQYLEELFMEGNIINFFVEKGLKPKDRIVDVHFDYGKKELTLWCDTDKIIQEEIVLRKLNED